jgi:predicted outer membrane repeat protein
MRTVVIALTAFVITPCFARIIIVDDNGPADFNNIQAAINDANSGDTIIVQTGTYTGPGNRDIDFLGKSITVQSSDPNDPNVVANTVIDCQSDANNLHRGFKFISGEDINSILSGLTIVNGCAPYENIFGDYNTYGGAVYCYGGNPIIKNCIMKNNSASRGGAVYCGLSSAIIKDSNFMNNTASYHGGAIFCRQSQVFISNSFFQSNIANSYGGAIYSNEGQDEIRECNVLSNQGKYGAGIASNNGETKIIDCTILNNNGDWGGGIFCYSLAGVLNSPLIQGCLISNNCGYTRGGGIFIGNNAITKDCIITYNQGLNGGGVNFVYSSGPIMINCIISSNGVLPPGPPAQFGGCGIQIQSGSRARISNCTISNNNMPLPGAGIRVVFGASPVVENCIIWGNIYAGRTDLIGSQICLNTSPATITLLYNDIEGGIENISLEYGGSIGLEVGTIDVDPCFADPCNLDFHLQSSAGRWDANSQIWVQDQNTSFCIDAGNPGRPFFDEPNDSNNVRIDMGAYGGTSQSSKTPSDWRSLADLTNDWQIDIYDFNILASNWLSTGCCFPGDLNRDQFVDFRDFAVFASKYYETYPAEP